MYGVVATINYRGKYYRGVQRKTVKSKIEIVEEKRGVKFLSFCLETKKSLEDVIEELT